MEHHAGLVDASYIEKAKGNAEYKQGDQVQIIDSDIDESYHLVGKLISDVSNSVTLALAKSPVNSPDASTGAI